jgi:hypothetical protein
MKKIEPGQVVSIIANVGVLGGILLLAYELNQNNELRDAEARISRTNMAVEAFRFFAENGDLAELHEREKRGEELSGAELRRINAAVMSVFLVQEWTFKEMSHDPSEMKQVREIQRYNFANRPEYRRVWELRKSSFDPAFIQWMEESVLD